MVNTLFENIVDEEFPMRGRLFNGVQINKGFVNVSSTYCNGFVNYIHDPHLVLLNRYQDEDEFVELSQQFVSQSDHDWYHTDLGKYQDDILVFGTNDQYNPDSYVLIWFDQDVSDCCIWRFDIHDFKGIAHFVSLMKKWLDSLEHSIKGYGFINRQPKGWIKF